MRTATPRWQHGTSNEQDHLRVKISTGQTLHPGGSASGELYAFDGTDYAPTGCKVKVYDWLEAGQGGDGRTFAVSGEFVMAIHDRSRRKLVTIGAEQGLVRKAYANDDIAASATGDCDVEGVTVSVLNTGGDLDAQDSLDVKYYWERGRWERLGTGSGTSTPGSSGPVWYRTQENWRQNGGDPRVLCCTVTGTPKRSSSSCGQTQTWVYLPRTRPGDPNVVSGTNILAQSDGEVLISLTDYLDDIVGTVKMFAGGSAFIPFGWALMDGTANAVANGGTGFSFLVGDNQERAFPRFTESDLDYGLSGGSSSTTIGDHEVADIIGLIDDHVADVTESDGEHSHGGKTDTGGSHDHGAATGSGGTGATGSSGTGATGSSTTGITIAEFTPGTEYIYVDFSDPQYEQTVVVQSLYSVNVTVNDSGHTHTGPSHTHTGPSHTHSIPSQAGHDHTVSNQLGHTHGTPALVHSAVSAAEDLAHDAIDVIPPYLYLMFIERIDNSADYVPPV